MRVVPPADPDVVAARPGEYAVAHVEGAPEGPEARVPRLPDRQPLHAHGDGRLGVHLDGAAPPRPRVPGVLYDHVAQNRARAGLGLKIDAVPEPPCRTGVACREEDGRRPAGSVTVRHQGARAAGSDAEGQVVADAHDHAGLDGQRRQLVGAVRALDRHVSLDDVRRPRKRPGRVSRDGPAGDDGVGRGERRPKQRETDTPKEWRQRFPADWILHDPSPSEMS